MSVTLPAAFLTRMRHLLGDRYDAFIASYSKPRAYGLRLNTLKIGAVSKAITRLQPMFHLESVPWCETGYYYDEETRPGRHPYHAAGVYYIQEPSAMSAAEYLSPMPGERVLDLAAAPGGKSTQIADRLQGQGILISNEIHPGRAAILSENIERMGIRNAVVTNATPGQLAERFPAYFDRIMVDAPCSGEGMFRKELEAITEWSEEQVSLCAARQSDILHDAMRMLRPGGTIAYSTCTFSEEENERVIDHLLNTHPELTTLRIERIWPHEHRGEGHFVAVLKHQGTDPIDHTDRTGAATSARKGKTVRPTSSQASRKLIQSAMQQYEAFVKDALLSPLELTEGEPVLFGEQLYWLPTAGDTMHIGLLHGIKTLRPGLHLGTVRKNRFEPSHALALTLTSDKVLRVCDLPAESKEATAYMRGETLPSEHKGWTLVTIDGYSLGWGKGSDGMLKNHYPKGLRRPN